MSGGAEPDHDGEHDMGGLSGLVGLDAVRGRLAGWIAVVRAERARRQAGATVARPVWKHLVFTGGPGAGKSRAARAVARIYKGLGILSYGHLDEVAAATLVGITSEETGALVGKAVTKGRGGVVMITGLQAWCDLPGRGQQMLARLYRELTESRELRRDELAVILAGEAGPVRSLLSAHPALAARFPAVIDFPGYDAGQLAGIFATLAGEAGFTLTPAAARKAAAVLAQADVGRGGGNARLAVRLLDQATARQARRVTAASRPVDPAELGTIRVADIPGHIHSPDPSAGEEWPGQYL